MKLLDLVVIGLYFLAMLAIGWYYSRRTETADDYLLGGRRMSPFLIGLSLFATLTSTLSYLAYPGEIVKYGPMMMAQITAFPAVMVVVGWWLIPAIMRQHDFTSGYELLEARLGLSGRLLGASMFVVLRTIWMASILYATSDKVLVPMLGLDRGWTPGLCAALGLITMIYTTEGGMRAVVITDAAQSLIMFAGAIVTILVVTASLGGLDQWWPSEWAPHWDPPVFWFRSGVRVTFLGSFLNMFVWLTCTAGSDQMAIQRYLSTRDAAAARRSFAVQLVTQVLMIILLAMVGFAVLAYFTARPDEFGPSVSLLASADELLPRFIIQVMPAGLSGLVIAAILSAAMSSLSSGMNSSSAVITTDFINRFSRATPTPHAQVRLAKMISVVIATLAIGLSMVIGHLAENLMELCFKVVNLLTAPLFVLFFLALFVPRATPLAGILAALASIGVAVSISFFKAFGLEFLWTAPCALAAGITVGMLASYLPLGKRD